MKRYFIMSFFVAFILWALLAYIVVAPIVALLNHVANNL